MNDFKKFQIFVKNNYPLILLALLTLLSCGKEGVPPAVAPSPTPSVGVADTPEETLLSGRVEGVEGITSDVATEVILIDGERNERARGFLKPDGSYQINILLKPSEGGFFKIRVLDREASVFLKSGKENTNLKIDPAGMFSMAVWGDDLQQAYLVASRMNAIATPQEIKEALNELQLLTFEKILVDFLNPHPKGRDAINALLKKIMFDDIDFYLSR